MGIVEKLDCFSCVGACLSRSSFERTGKECSSIVFWCFAPFFGAQSGFERRTMGGGG